MSEGELSAAGGFTPPSEVLSSAIGPTGEDIFAGTVGLMEQAEALEQVPCRSTAEVIASLEGQLEQIQQAGCCDCRVSIADVQLALESLQAVPIGQCASLATKLALELSSLPQMPSATLAPFAGLPPGTTIVLPPQPSPVALLPAPGEALPLPESPAGPAPAEGEAPAAPAVPPHVPIPGEVCPPDPDPAPLPGDLVKVAPDCGAQLHALGGPVAEAQMMPAVFYTSPAGHDTIGIMKKWHGPLWDLIDDVRSLQSLVVNSLSDLPEVE